MLVCWRRVVLEERWRQLWDPRPACVVPLTPGLARRPGWLALIALFFSRYCTEPYYCLCT